MEVRKRERERRRIDYSRASIAKKGEGFFFVRSSSRRDSGSLASGERIPSSETLCQGGVYRAEMPRY